MRKIFNLLIAQIKKNMRTDPFTTPQRRTMLSYYFDIFISVSFELCSLYVAIVAIFEESLQQSLSQIIFCALVGILFKYLVDRDLVVIHKYRLYLERRKQEKRQQTWFNEARQGQKELKESLS